MPVQRFAAMTKDFATFDCDAHVTEPPLIWDRAAEYLTREEMQHCVRLSGGMKRAGSSSSTAAPVSASARPDAAEFPARCG
jgi:hypothetical protein